MNQMEQTILKFVGKRIHQLYDSPPAQSVLRKGVGKQMDEKPELLCFTLPEENISNYRLQEEQIEQALYTTLTLYACHQQGKSYCVNSDTWDSFGKAVQTLRLKNAKNENGINARFNRILTANNLKELSMHVYSLIKLMKQHDIKINYPLLAVTLYKFQRPEYKNRIILNWQKDNIMITGKDDK